MITLAICAYLIGGPLIIMLAAMGTPVPYHGTHHRR